MQRLTADRSTHVSAYIGRTAAFVNVRNLRLHLMHTVDVEVAPAALDEGRRVCDGYVVPTPSLQLGTREGVGGTGGRLQRQLAADRMEDKREDRLAIVRLDSE